MLTKELSRQTFPHNTCIESSLHTLLTHETGQNLVFVHATPTSITNVILEESELHLVLQLVTPG